MKVKISKNMPIANTVNPEKAILSLKFLNTDLAPF